MKARVKATGEIGIVSQIDILLNDDFISLSPNRVELLTSYADVFTEHSPDYWTRLEHQYAGMAMQGVLSNQEYVHSLVQRVAGGEIPNLAEGITKHAEQLAHALVEKMKEERE